jgi:hypothetical protein
MALLDMADGNGNVEVDHAVLFRTAGVTKSEGAEAVKALFKTGNLEAREGGGWHLKGYEGYLKIYRKGSRRDYFREYKRKARAAARAKAKA